ncbi:hypothetical protein MATL_G00167800 [Megalops atlanticus]|uniref:ZP domain-containing protein n=1 Tax=Megalops atlanticus TaxID=7932 RepID=A0A9D3T0F8_MEGAT|nr:hypothetical protein MATL_G00167800 [Megalops atlanticus]
MPNYVPFCKKVRTVLSALLLCLLPTCTLTTVPMGTFQTDCHDHHFWLTIKSSFLGQIVRFDIEDHGSVHFLSSQRAAECGYTVLFDSHGDLVLRASFLACYVDNQKDTEFWLHVWFVNKEAGGKETAYPFQLACGLQWPWSPREIVCEKNYMEVSVRKEILAVNPKGLEWEDPPHVASEEEEKEGLKEWQMVFRRPEHPSPLAIPLREAQAMGYHVSTTSTRIVLRCPYSSTMSYTLKERGVQVEAVSASILYQYLWKLLTVDASVACPMNEATVDGDDMVVTFPQVLPPLVQGRPREGWVGVGIGAHLLSECSVQERGYKIRAQDGAVEVRIPVGAKGMHVKSGIIDKRYAQSLSVDLLYAQRWEDSQWGSTQHLSYRPLHTPYTLRPPTLINNTIPSQKMFSVTLGTFPQDVSLQNVTIGDKRLSQDEALQLGLKISHVPFANGSHAYQLQVPFSHPLVSHEDVDRGYRRYTLVVTFALSISPYGEVFYHHGTVVSALRDVVPPRLEGKCSDKGVVVLLYFGNQDLQWEMYLGGRRLDQELAELGGYVMENEEDYFSIELPVYSLGMAYEELSLQGLRVKVEAGLMNVETGKVERSFVQRCTFPARELLVCLPEGRIVVVVDTSRTIPPVDPHHTTLLDQSCGPIDTDGTRALFSFRLDSCGTIRTREGNVLLYVNEVRYSEKLLLRPEPLVHPKPYYRLPIHCRYPVNDTSTLSISLPLDPALTPLFPGPSRTHGALEGGLGPRPFTRDNGVHKLEANYAAECGYTFSAFSPKDVLILRASYFACHVENKGDAEFTLHYHIVKLDETGKQTTYPSQISCKLNIGWKPREVLCEENYIEEMRLSECQVLIRKSNGTVSLSVEEARSQGYVVAATPHRIVFRSPYNKPWAEIQMVDDIEVETIGATVAFRQNWALVMIETTPACAMSNNLLLFHERSGSF